MASPEVGHTIALALARSNRTQAQMARDLGLSQKHVSQVLTGKSSGHIDTIRRMLDYVGLELTTSPKEESEK